MNTSITLKFTAVTLLKAAVLVTVLNGLTAAIPDNLTRINPTLSVVAPTDTGDLG